jgi:apolipoprotein N-acyltransferase
MPVISQPATRPARRLARRIAWRAARPQRSCLDWRWLLVGLIIPIAGGLHAAGWLFPGSWCAAWMAQCATIGVAVAVRPRSAFACGTAVGIVGIGLSFYWGVAALKIAFDASAAIAWSVFAALVAMEALGFGVFCWATSRVAQNGAHWLWVIPCAWTAIEQFFPRVFPWRLAYSQLELLPLIQIGEFAGAAGISFIVTSVAAIPATVWLGFRPRARFSERQSALLFSSSAAGLLAAALLVGSIRLRQWDEWCQRQPKLAVGLVQVDPAYVGAENNLRDRSLAIHDDVDLVCWPESSLGTYSNSLGNFRDSRETLRLSRDSSDTLEVTTGLHCHVLAGGKLYDEGTPHDSPVAMTAFLISPDQDILGRYRKRTLLPFGEYVPGQSWFPAIRQWATLPHVVEAGNDARPLIMLDGSRLGVVICYEDTLAANARQTVAAGAEALFSLIQGTNFENPLTLVQHQRLAVMRAVENRRYFVRCASTGVTCIISPTGRVTGHLPLQVENTLIGQIALVHGRTFYNRTGDAFAVLCTFVAMIGLAAAKVPQNESRRWPV